MCGIVGAVAQRDVAAILIAGLKQLEYRGYDSAGLAIISADKQLHCLRRVGKVEKLQQAVIESPVFGGTGIAHTRWATHGIANETNAHPHISHQQIAVVHNGIIENHQQLRQQLIEQGYTFSSETDTEVITHLTHFHLQTTETLLEAVQKTIKQLQGAYGTVIIDKNDPEQMIVARSGSPLVIGYGLGEHFVASDPLALLAVTRRFSFLEEGDIAQISRFSVKIFDAQGDPVKRDIVESQTSNESNDKGQYKHYMLKEIFEQPLALQRTLAGRIQQHKIAPDCFPNEKLQGIEHIQIIACGTSYHAALVARYWFESLAGISCNVEIASEFRYRKSVTPKNSLLITLSQSGETADTLAALRLAKQLDYQTTLTICNSPESSLVRESDIAYMMKAGREVGVASSKAFTVQLAALLMLVATLGRQHQLSADREKQIVEALQSLPAKIEQVLAMEQQIKQLAEGFADKHHSLFLGRGEQYPIAMEGALKLKEISYIHAEAYAAGELKHGPLALVDADMPVIVVAPDNELLEKLKSNVEEVRARGGLMIVFADKNSGFKSDDTMQVLEVPHCDPIIAPIVYTIPLQLLSYHVALIKGTDVDQPRNLAKSVTVE
ncbi:glutamine--fructose-6-phosphate transaminase (isomerizing) [Psychromonas hadalis]|uniref:glutamine--fructose-6-phosphate transaminase (isomerizing) n=1 Tax=Psychromonas hadalis TaxID=211669 RepID=UPI0003B5E6C6|nr:glutamine--fructose-6-phosphate transaminase (isomerizing) [Psychromonas hadalis]